MKQERIREIAERIRKVKVAVYGDFCLDAYWIMDPEGSEFSLETGKKAEAVRKHYYSPGGASNIAANLAALQPAEIKAIGVIGNDIFGRELASQLLKRNIDISGLVIQDQNFNTYTFTKKYIDEEEEPRIDFGIFNKRSQQTDDILIVRIREALQNSDILIFNQQFPGSITRPEFIDRVNELFLEFTDRIVLLDSRHYNEKFRHVYRKTNAEEIARLTGTAHMAGEKMTLKKTAERVQKVFKENGKPVFVTCGNKGIVTCDGKGIHVCPGIQFLKRLDTVGAGDTVISALGLCLAAGISTSESAEFANFAAAVTVQKLFITGTATPDEIEAISVDPDFIYNPDLAEDQSSAVYLPGTGIEICDDQFRDGEFNIRHAVFDHDGTISVLRSGWELVMEKIMINSITGGKTMDLRGNLLSKIRSRVIDYIEKSTGVQTIIQMQALVDMTGEFNLVPPEKRLDKFGYKKLYNQALLDHIRSRIVQVKENLFSREDFIVPGAVRFLNELKKRNIKLYLASGTDKEYVEEEASLLGYAELFDGGIYGALDDPERYSKKRVIENILLLNQMEGNQLIVFGDGPVEIRECRKQGGIAIGVASDEKKMTGIDPAKRSRLIKAGAHMVMTDFREFEPLLKYLFPHKSKP